MNVYLFTVWIIEIFRQRYMYVEAEGSIQNMKMKDYGSLMNFQIDSDLLWEYRSGSRVLCVVECFSSRKYTCTSFAYNNLNSMCRHYNTHNNVGFSGNPVPGWKYYVTECPVLKGFTYNKEIGMCYVVVPGTRSYTDSEALCRQQYGAELPIVNTIEKQNLIVSEIEKHTPMNGIFLGAIRSGFTYYWIDGEVFSSGYRNWDTSQPEFKSDEMLVAIRKVEGYKWHDHPLTLLTGTICEFRKI